MKERNGWRAVIHLNVVRSINTVLKVVEAGINNNFDSDDDATNPDGSMKFTDRHQLFMIRLAPLAIVEADLKRRLGSFSDTPFPSAPQCATPFDAPEDDSLLPSRREFTVRSWRDLLEKEATMTKSSIAGYKDDMKALWNDPVVRQALKSRRLQIGDTAGL